MTGEADALRSFHSIDGLPMRFWCLESVRSKRQKILGKLIPLDGGFRLRPLGFR